jgi:hypothetical protein
VSTPDIGGGYDRSELHLSIGHNPDQLLVNCEFCKRIIASIDLRVLPLEIEPIVLAALKVHLHRVA